MWFDKASPGMLNDNIHIVNPGTSSATVTVSLTGVTFINVTVLPGAQAFVSFPPGTYRRTGEHHLHAAGARHTARPVLPDLQRSPELFVRPTSPGWGANRDRPDL